ncbi:MAG: SDR family oxidoreductase [Pseudomonadota bacterium]
MSAGDADRPHAIITGGSQGIGLAVGQRLAAQGFALTLIARGETALAAAQDTLSPAPVLTMACDVARGDALAAVMKDAVHRLGPCHTLVTAAGTVEPGAFDTLDAAAFERQMAVNYFGTVAAVRAVYGSMCERRQGRIVLVSTAAALIGIYGYTAYAGSKFAVRGFAEALRTEARPYGVAVSISYPGDTDTAQYARECETRPPETAAIAGSASLSTADAVADAIVRGMDRGTFAIYPNAKTALLGRTASLVAPLAFRSFDKTVMRLKGRRGR